MSGGWRDRRVPEFQAYLRNVLGREPTERDYAAAIMQLEARGPGSVAVGHAFRNRIAADGGDAASHLRHYDPVALGHRWREVTPAAIDKWGAEYDKIASGEGPLRPGQTHFFSPAGMQAYYNKDPSLVRSSVRMDVPGHGEVLVPSWATKAVAAGDFVNVNGQWHLTPNERYGQDVASPAPVRDAAPVRDVSSASSSPPPAPSDPAPRVASDTAITSPSPSSAIDAAMRVARGFGSQPQQETESIIETTSGGMPRPRAPTQMAEAVIPYLDKTKTALRLARADGGEVTREIANDFKPLTAEQKAMIDRDRIDESLGPFDFMPGGLTKFGAGLGAAVGGFLPGGLTSIPKMARANRSYGEATPVLTAVKDGALQTGVVGGGTAAVAYASELAERLFDRKAREDRMMKGEFTAQEITGQPDENFKYPPPFPRLERTEDQMRERYDSTRTGDYRDNKHGIFGGGKMSFDDWMELQETYGGTLHYAPSMNVFGRDYAVGPESKGYGHGPYKAAPDADSIGRASGGGIDDTGANIPETRESLMAQQRQLIEGRRAAQMFPFSTEELPLPPGMERIETSRGVFHFDPMRISARDIEMASIDGRENEILGLGPLSKDDVARLAMETGEAPVAITERDRSGNELRASLATPSTVPMQSDDMLRSAAPDNTIDVEPVGAVVEQRGIGPGVVKRASGGGIGSRPIVGPLIGATGGRADKVPGTARSGSHVLPADVVAHMGQGNTNAGLRALEKMFKTGPYGMPLARRRRADGGEVGSGEIPVMLSDGEFVVPPEVVASLGDGDIQTGHDVLDAWIMDERSKHIQTLQALPPPATD